MNHITFISGCDEKYYPLLREWFHSVRRLCPEDTYDINILDSGLSAAQLQELKPLVKQIIKPNWPCDLPEAKIKDKEFLKSCVCRPFLNQIFPGYDFYIWMDADTWLQDISAVDLLLQGARKSDLAIVPQSDRAYGKSMRLQWLGPLPWRPRSFYYSNARKAFGGTIARALFPFTTLNAGVFALSAKAPHWQAWQDLIIEALKKGKIFTAEQLTLGILVYLKSYKAELLPAWCNWLCEHKPIWDEKENIFTAPYIPNEKIGIMHLSGFDDMRLNRSITTSIKTIAGVEKSMSLRYPFLDGERPLGP